MQKKVTLMGVGATILVLLAMFLVPSAPNLDKYKKALQRGQHQQVSRELGRELKRHPSWWEGRELMVEVALNQGRLDLVWGQLLALREGKQRITALQLELGTWLSDNDPDPQYVEEAIAQAKLALGGEDYWSWGVEYFLQMLVKLERGEEVPFAIDYLESRHTGEISFAFVDLLCSAHHLMVGACTSHQAWASSLVLEAKVGRNPWRQYTLQWLPNAQLASLQEEYPGDALLAAARAREMAPRQGLDFLLSWEGKNNVPEKDKEAYAELKTEIIGKAEVLLAQDLDELSIEHLYQAAMEATPWSEKCQVVLTRLVELEADPDVVARTGKAMAGPKPYLTIDAETITTGPLADWRDFILSPDGNWLIICRGQEWSLCNLNTGVELPIPIQEPHIWEWSPDSSRFAGSPWVGAEVITVFDIQGQATTLAPGPDRYIPRGWYDEQTLWVQPVDQEYLDSLGPPLLCNVQTGEVKAGEVTSMDNGALVPGPGEALAWIGENGDLYLIEDEQVVELSSPAEGDGWAISSWVPQGTGMIITDGQGLKLWEGGLPRDLGVEGIFLGWKNSREFYWAQLLPGEYYRVSYPFSLGGTILIYRAKTSLYTYNLATGEVEAVGVVGQILGATNNTVIVYAYGELRVYCLP